jgi:tetratricopeptide (TPR) repeat protein
VNKARELDPTLPELQSCLEGVHEVYAEGESRYVRLAETIGHPIDIQYDPVQLYRQQKRLKEAETYLRQQLQDRAISLGASSRSRVSMLSVLALIYFEERQYSESDATFDEAYKCSVSAFGTEHSQTISTMNYHVKTLMSSWSGLSRLEKTLPNFLALKERLMGPHENTVLNTRYQLGWVQYNRGLYDNAISTWEVLADQRRLLNGIEHRETLITLTSLSRALLAKGRLAEAEIIQREVVETSERTMEEDDLDNLDAKEALAAILLKRGDLVEAQELAFTAMSLIEDQYDDDDINVITMIMTWARTLAACAPEERPKDAPQPTDIMEDVVGRLTQSCGEDAPPTLVALAELALMWHDRGDSEKARAYAKSALAGWERLYNGSGIKLLECQEMLSEIL